MIIASKLRARAVYLRKCNRVANVQLHQIIDGPWEALDHRALDSLDGRPFRLLQEPFLGVLGVENVANQLCVLCTKLFAKQLDGGSV